MKLTILSREDAQDSEFCSFFVGRLKEHIAPEFFGRIDETKKIASRFTEVATYFVK